MARKELTQFYITCMRPVAEYAWQTCHNSLPNHFSSDLQRLQKLAMRINQPERSDAEAFKEAGLQLLSERRQRITSHFFEQIDC